MDQPKLATPGVKFYKYGTKPDHRPTLEDALNIQENVPFQEQLEDDFSFWIEKRFISANDLQHQRFNSGHNYIQRSPAVLKFMHEDLLDHDITYITGPSGMGKSYAILFYVLMRRKYNDFPVLYINNPKALLQRWRKYIVNEVIYAIAGNLKSQSDLDEISREVFELKGDEKRPHEELSETFSRILDNYDDDDLLRLIEKLHRFYDKIKKQHFVCIFDQYNDYEEECNKFEEAKRLTSRLLSIFDKKIFVRSSLEPIATTITDNEIFLGLGFDSAEAIQYLMKKLEEKGLLIEELKGSTDMIETDMNVNEDVNTNAFLRIKQATELIPYELETFIRLALKSPDWPIGRLLEKYYSDRIEAIIQIHKKWIKTLDLVEADRVYQFIFCLDNSLTHGRNLLIKPDPNLMYYNEVNQQWCYRSRLVQEAVHRYYRDSIAYIDFLTGHLHKFINDMVKIMLNADTPGRTKEGLFKRLIEYVIRIAVNRQEDYKIKCYSRNNELYTLNLPFNNTRIRTFDVENLGFQVAEILNDKNVGVLVPNNPDMPYIDFIMFDARDEKRMMYLFQVTINVKSHEKSDVFYRNEIEKASQGKRAEFVCKTLFDITTNYPHVQTQFVWFGGDDLDSKIILEKPDLLQNKHIGSWITLTRLNPQLSKFL